MCTVLLPPGVNPIAVDKYIISNTTVYRHLTLPGPVVTIRTTSIQTLYILRKE